MNWPINIILWQLIGQVLSEPEYLDCSSLIIDKNDSSITIECCGPKLPSWEPKPDQTNTTKLIFNGCRWTLIERYLSEMKSVKTLEIGYSIDFELTNKSFEGLSKLTKLYLRGNGIQEIPDGVFKHLYSLEELHLGENNISEISSEVFYDIPLKHLNLSVNRLRTLNLNAPSLEYLDVSNNRLESLTADKLSKLVHISLDNSNLINMINETFKKTSLESIRFFYGHITIPNKFLTNLEHLRFVCFKSLDLTEVPENMIWNSSNITQLSLASSDLKNLPEKFFRDSTKMKELDLSNNKIKNIDSGLLKPLEQLEKLDLSYNSIVQIESASLSLPMLKVLNLCQNNINNLSPNYLFSFEKLPVVETINLSLNKINHFDRGWSSLKTLITINLDYNKITFLEVDDIQLFSRNAEVNLTNNPLQFINLSRLVEFASVQEKENNTKPRKIYLSGYETVCDCRNYEFLKFVHRKMPSVVYNELEINEDLECHGSRTKFSEINTDSLTCDWDMFEVPNKTNNCSSECLCTYRPHDNSALMNCSNKQLNSAPEQIISSQYINYTDLDLSNNFITKLPDYKQWNIRKLNVSHNNLTTINFIELPRNLEELYLEYNNIMHISGINSTDMLTRLKHITMKNNSWDCNYDRGNNINIFFNKYSSKIDDLSGKQLCPLPSNSKLTEEQNDTNKKQDDLLLIIIVVIIVTLLCFVYGVLLFLFIKRYKTRIATWLYSNNITWLIPEEPFDQDKKYDAFISFSSEDLEFVSNHLVPGLEEGNQPFKLCLHYRDWEVGDFIPAQIARSVDESKKTVVVLSKNYLLSVWGRTEFRMAYKLAYSNDLNERRSRIIVILYGDISTKDLDPELKSYLSMNTYIKWGDRWFWDKLRYALPRRPRRVVIDNPNIIIPDKLNPLKLL